MACAGSHRSRHGRPPWRTSRMSSWSDSKPPKVRLVRRATTSRRSPSWTRLGDVGAPERDPVEHVALAAKGQLAVAAGRGADAGHGQAEDGDERVRVPGPARGERRQFAMEARSRRPGPGGPGRPRAGAAGRAGRGRRRAPGSGRGTRPSARSAISKPAAPAWPPKRMNRSPQASSVAPRSSDAVAPAGRTDDVAEVRADDRRASALLGQPSGDEARRCRRSTGRERPSRRRSGRRPSPRRRGLGDRRLHEVAPGQVGRLERVGVGCRPPPRRRPAAAARPRGPPRPGRPH